MSQNTAGPSSVAAESRAGVYRFISNPLIVSTSDGRQFYGTLVATDRVGFFGIVCYDD